MLDIKRCVLHSFFFLLSSFFGRTQDSQLISYQSSHLFCLIFSAWPTIVDYVRTNFPVALPGSSTPACHRNCRRPSWEPSEPPTRSLSAECGNICRWWCSHLLCPGGECSSSWDRRQPLQAGKRKFNNQTPQFYGKHSSHAFNLGSVIRTCLKT